MQNASHVGTPKDLESVNDNRAGKYELAIVVDAF
jgi:hypothetical protein